MRSGGGPTASWVRLDRSPGIGDRNVIGDIVSGVFIPTLLCPRVCHTSYICSIESEQSIIGNRGTITTPCKIAGLTELRSTNLGGPALVAGHRLAGGPYCKDRRDIAARQAAPVA